MLTLKEQIAILTHARLLMRTMAEHVGDNREAGAYEAFVDGLTDALKMREVGLTDEQMLEIADMYATPVVIEGHLILVADDDEIQWVALDSNGRVFGYKNEPSFDTCNCGCNASGWTTGTPKGAMFLRELEGHFSAEQCKNSLHFVGKPQ